MVEKATKLVTENILQGGNVYLKPRELHKLFDNTTSYPISAKDFPQGGGCEPPS